MVKERFGLGSWKLPGGHADPGEDIDTAAIREVKEETGISTKSLGIISLRHMHKLGVSCESIIYYTHIYKKRFFNCKA